MKHSIPLILSAGLVMVSAAAIAGDDMTSEEKFKKIDVNADGAVSEAEWVAYKTADGKTTADEALAKFAAIAGDDASISAEEYKAASLKWMQEKADIAQ